MLWHGSRLITTVNQAAITFQVRDGEDVELSVRGETYVVGRSPVRVKLTGQGPRLEGLLDVNSLVGTKRRDGTTVTATVPHSWSEEIEGGEGDSGLVAGMAL
jgi:alpha,alpha-trehalose phosphorylase